MTDLYNELNLEELKIKDRRHNPLLQVLAESELDNKPDDTLVCELSSSAITGSNFIQDYYCHKYCSFYVYLGIGMAPQLLDNGK